MNEAIKIAVEIIGNKKKLAEICGVSHTAVKKWLYGGGISVTLAQKIENATSGQVTVYEIAKGVKEAKNEN